MSVPKTTEEKKEVTFDSPHIYEPVKNKPGKQAINYAKSGICKLTEALGTPKIFYEGRRNKYFKDKGFTKAFTDEEIQGFGLPIPAELEDKRRKLHKKVLEEGLDMTYDDIIKQTMPPSVQPPDHIKARLAKNDPLDRTLRRLNRSTLGK